MEDGSNISEEDQQMMTMMMVSSTGKQLPFSSSPSASSPHNHHQQQLFPAAAALKSNSCEAEEEEEEEEAGHGGQRESNAVIEKEHMFDKVVTPSDVGKLNRLVIPKQHAEKYFPLDSSTNEKGLLLNFEDRNGKPWRFRYSYWNSSQSYVMTKGWSRFVKDKKLDAGDIVSFQRGVGEFGRDRLFIDWRRRPDAPGHTISSSSFSPSSSSLYHHQHQYQYPFSSNSNTFPWNNSTTSANILMRPPAPVLPNRPSNPSSSRNIAYYNRPVTGTTIGGAGLYGYNGGYGNYTSIYNSPISPPNNSASAVFYMRPAAAVGPQWRQQQQQQDFGGDGVVGGSGGVVVEPMVYESLPVVQGKAAAKRLRLFGVNMDCPITTAPNSDSEENLSSTSSTTTITNTTTSGRMLTVEAPHPPSQQQQYPFQLRLYNGTRLPSSAPQFIHKEGKSSSSSMSLDLELSDGPMSRTSN